jgi:benzoyl-CoA-dihydrodiol lyase
MLSQASHVHKVNFCKFTNETRNEIEDASESSRQRYLAAVSGNAAGGGYELALAADRSYMLDLPDHDDAPRAPKVRLSAMNFGAYPMVNGLPRVAARFYEDEEAIERAREQVGQALDAATALELGLVTATPDDLDWDEEIRIALEERASLSPDALTGMEASLRFGLPETMETRVFGRLSAWQNWIFIRPNAVGPTGALKLFGSGSKAKFGWERV